MRKLLNTAALLAVFAVLTLPVAATGGDGDGEVHGLVGGAFGYSYHNRVRTALDGVSGATTGSGGTDDRLSGARTDLVADFGLFSLGPGAVGLRVEAGFTIPGPFYSAALMPRYRLEFPYSGQTVRAISPWLGLGVGVVFPEVLGSKQFFMVALSAGLDFAVVSRDTFVGLQLDMNKFTILGHEEVMWHEDGESDNYKVVLSNINFKVVLTRRFY